MSLSKINVAHGALATSQTATPNASFASDQQVLAHWLAIFDLRSPQTARSYRSHAAKFTLFLQLSKPQEPPETLLKFATEFDVAAFESVISHTPLPSGQSIRLTCPPSLLKAMGIARCPFERPMKKSSVNLTLSVLHAMFEFMRAPPGDEIAAYRTSNPSGRVVRRKDRSIKQTNRHIPIEGIKAIRLCAQKRLDSATTNREKMLAGRTKFAVDLLFGLWARRHEMTSLRARDLQQDVSGQWLINVVRKGGDEGQLPMPDWVMQSLLEYRQTCGIFGAPHGQDTTPLLMSFRGGKAHPISDQTLYNDICFIAQRTALQLEELAAEVGLKPELIASMQKRLDAISPHWFRHSGATIMLNEGLMDLKHVSKVLGHANEATTTKMYFHEDASKVRDGLNAVSALLAPAS